MTTTPITTAAVPEATSTSRTRAFQIAWGLAMCFYFLEYASRSAPAVMIPELTQAFGTTAVGVSAILGTYYYTYSVTSLIAGAALDRVGAKKAVPVGIFILAVGCLLFSIPTATAGYAGRLLQGAGSAFAFTGAVYLAVHGFSARWLATAIGITQCRRDAGWIGRSIRRGTVARKRPRMANGLALARHCEPRRRCVAVSDYSVRNPLASGTLPGGHPCLLLTRSYLATRSPTCAGPSQDFCLCRRPSAT